MPQTYRPSLLAGDDLLDRDDTEEHSRFEGVLSRCITRTTLLNNIDVHVVLTDLLTVFRLGNQRTLHCK